MTEASDREAVSEVLRALQIDESWMDALDLNSPEWLVKLQRETIDAYRAGDVDWLLEHAHPEVEIFQPRELPDSRSYRGHEGVLEAMLDWPREWEDFRVEPKRTFALDGGRRFIVDAVHHGRSRKMGFQVDVQIVWLLAYEGEQMRRWEMFMNVDDALEAAGVS
jgi:ketosteroid isomerase-like protein